MSKIKVIFIDIDGTLIDKENKITPGLVSAIKRLQENNILVILTSGRGLKSVREIAKKCGASSISIASNGAIVKDFSRNKVLFKKCLPRKEVRKVWEYGSSHKCLLKGRTSTLEYVMKSKEDVKQNILEIVLESSNYERMKIIPYLFQDKIPNVVIANSSKELLRDQSVPKKIYFHDISPTLVSKGTGICEVLDYLHLSKSDALCIGDSDNDIPMTLVCGTSIAVEGSTKNLQKVSTKVLKESLEDFLNDLIKKEEIL